MYIAFNIYEFASIQKYILLSLVPIMEILEQEIKEQDLKNVEQNPRNKEDALRVAVYVDVANVWNAALNRKVHLDMRDIMDAAKRFGRVVIARAYICYAVGGRVNPEILNLLSSGFEIITRYVSNTSYSLKKDVDTNLVSDLIEDLFTIAPDIIVVVSDDSDFVPAILKAKKRGVECISLVNSFEKAHNLVGASNSSYELSFDKSAKGTDSTHKVALDTK